MPAPPRIEQLTADDFPELMDMLLACFRVQRPDHPEFDVMFPDVYQPTDEQMGCNYVIRQDGRIASCVTLVPVDVQIDNQPARISGIAGVSTRPEFRGQHLMQTVLDHVTRQIADQGYAFSCLGGDRRRYSPWGYELAVNECHFWLTPRAAGLAEYLGKLTGPIIECDLDQAHWPTIWQQAQKNPTITVCGEQTLKSKYKRIGQKLLYLDDPDGGHIVMGPDKSQTELCAWGGQPQLVGAILAEKLSSGWNKVFVRLPWYPDHYCPIFKALMGNYSLGLGVSIAIYDLEKTLRMFKSHLDRRVRDFHLKGAIRLAVGPCRQTPAQEILLEADGSELAISPATGPAPKIELTRGQAVELMFTPLLVGWSVRLDPQFRWLTNLFPVPFFLPRLFHV